MKRENYLKRFKELTDLMYKTTEAKNHDYAGDGDCFKNFKLASYLTNDKISVMESILVRMADKIQRTANLLYNDAKVKDEKITDALLDLSVYSLISIIYMESDGKEEK